VEGVAEDAYTKPRRGLSAPWRLLCFVCYLGSMLDSGLGESAAKGGTVMRHLTNRSVLFLVGIICVASVAFTTLAQAETLVESTTFFRIVVGLSVDQKAAQAWLPAPWKVVSLPKGPFKGTNVFVLFNDWFIIQDGEGKPVHGGTLCCASLVAYAKNPQTGEMGPFVLRIYAPNDDFGPYKNTVKAKVFRGATLQGADLGGRASEVWTVQDSAGGIMEFRIDYKRAVPKRWKREFKVRSAVEPDILFNYRDDRTSDYVKSIPAGIDRVKNYKFRTTISELSKMFDGSEKLVGISVNPCFVRQVFLP
jgi:hypothetical protein